MDFEVKISRRAVSDLREIARFVARDNPEAALDLTAKLMDCAASLRRFPFRHAKDPHRAGVRKMPVTPYLIYYSINENTRVVSVLHFWHAARQHPIP